MNTKLSTNRKLSRMFANVLSIFVILALAFPVMGSAYAQEPAVPEGWHDGSYGEVDPGACVAFGWSADPDDRDRDVQIRILSDGDAVATTAASDYGEDMEQYGICPEGTCRFTVNLWDLISHDQEHQITIQAYDVESNDWWNLEGTPKSLTCQTPSPHFTVFPEWEFFDGLDWPDGATVSISVADKPECSLERESWGGFFNGNFPEGCNIEAGDTVTFDDGTTNRWHIVRNLYVTDVDTSENTVTGRANAGETVYVWPHDGWFEPLQTTVGGLGVWQVDLDDAAYSIREDSEGRSEIRDEMGNATASDWHVTHPRFTVFPEWEWFDGNDWPNEAMVTITVEGKDECTTMKESWGYFFNGSFGEGCDLEIGDTVTFTDGRTIQTHTVQNLTVTKANRDEDTIKGIADPGAEVYVWPHATGEQLMATAKTRGMPTGQWHVDFSPIYDLVPGECGRSEIRDEFANSTAVDWCIANPRIVASESGDWFWTTEFKPGDLDISIFDSSDVGANLLWSGEQVADESGFAFVGFDIHGQDLAPGNYLVVSDGDSQKGIVLQPISVTMFDTQADFMAGFAPAGSEVWAAAGPQDWQERRLVSADPVTGEWRADFAPFDILEEYQPWSYAHIYDDDGDANEGGVPPLQNWIAVYTYDFGTWEVGNHSYYLGDNWGHVGDPVSVGVSADVPLYDRYVLLRGARMWAQTTEGCQVVDSINPTQLTRFHSGWPTDYPMTFEQAMEYFDALTPWVVVDDGASIDLQLYAIMPYSPETWQEYFCTFTADLVLDASQPDWVDSGITVSAGQTFTIEAFGLMNPCSDTYPNGSEICIFYTPVGGEWAVPEENDFGVFPGPGLPFMALLGRIGDGQPFLVGEGGTFTAEESGTLWFTSNDNLRTDNQGAYGVLIWTEP